MKTTSIDQSMLDIRDTAKAICGERWPELLRMNVPVITQQMIATGTTSPTAAVSEAVERFRSGGNETAAMQLMVVAVEMEFPSPSTTCKQS